MNKRTFHLLFGLTMLGLGIFGIIDEWYNVIDFVLGLSAIVLTLWGTVLIAVGGKRSGFSRTIYVSIGLFLFCFGVFGIYDEWGTVRDLGIGIIPVLSLMFGTLALVAGVNRLKN
ncbi:MAG: hypothetical protein ISR65_02065 [Bacteriovoracaceae bacterium]|nr:hypothetical protein [Bacteriovoracaceae bacterium]